VKNIEEPPEFGEGKLINRHPMMYVSVVVERLAKKQYRLNALGTLQSFHFLVLGFPSFLNISSTQPF
jgi:hypothetical protein